MGAITARTILDSATGRAAVVATLLDATRNVSVKQQGVSLSLTFEEPSIEYVRRELTETIEKIMEAADSEAAADILVNSTVRVLASIRFYDHPGEDVPGEPYPLLDEQDEIEARLSRGALLRFLREAARHVQIEKIFEDGQELIGLDMEDDTHETLLWEARQTLDQLDTDDPAVASEAVLSYWVDTIRSFTTDPKAWR